MMKRINICTLLLFLGMCFNILGNNFPASATGSIALSKRSITIRVGKTKQLKVKNTRKKVTWKSSRPKIATVTKTGKIKAKRKGTSIITATVGKKKLRCTVKVIAKKKTSTTTATTEQQPDVMEQTTKDDGWIPGWY